MSLLLSVVMHDAASKECKRKMGEAYALNKKMNGNIGDDDLKDLRRKLETDGESNIRNQRPKTQLKYLMRFDEIDIYKN